MSAAAAKKVVRNDPKPRPLNGMTPYSVLENRDPDRHYVFVFTGADANMQGPGYYEALGYRREVFHKDGVRMAGMKLAAGEPIVSFGHILMSCSMERYREIEAFGPMGDSGQTEATATEQRLIKRRGAQDAIRGISGMRSARSGRQYVDVENETTGLREFKSLED